MSNNNGFLSNYNKDMGNSSEPVSEIVVNDMDLGYKYEEKSGFKKPEYRGGSDLPPFRRPKLLVPIVVGAAVVVGVVVLLLLLLNGGVAVINFQGMTLSDAQLWANQNGVMLKLVDQYNDEVEANSIISQDIAEGKSVKKGEFLTLTVSKGHDMSVMLKVPDIMNMTADEIQAWANTNFMSKVRVTTEFSDTVPSGKVIRFTINDNTVVSDEIRRDTPVYVIISKGVEDQSTIQITVPDFKTMTISEAYIFANENGLILTVSEQYDDYVPKGSVISQNVKAQEKINKGSEIKLVVSKGKMIEIPDFSMYTKEQASAVASDLGLPVSIIEQYSRSRNTGALVSQSISAGSIYEEGDYLELTYSLGKQVMMPSFVGQTEDALRSWINDLVTKKATIKINTPVNYTYSSAPKGTIISLLVNSSPYTANMLVYVDAKITITVSLGELVYVPDLVDPSPLGGNRGYDTAITREEATAICNSLGLVPVFKQATGDTTDRLPGEIVSQNPSAGTESSEGSTITLYYVPIQQYTVVNIVDDNISEQDALDTYGIYLTITFVEYDQYVAGMEGLVVKQSLTPGKVVNRGAAITLYIGPAS